MKRVVGVFRGVLRLPIAACSVIARYRQQAGTSDIAAARSLVVGGVGRVRQLHSIHRSYTPTRLLGSRAPLFHRAYSSSSSSPSPIHMAATPEPVNVEIRGQQVPVSAGAGIDAKGLQDAISAGAAAFPCSPSRSCSCGWPTEYSMTSDVWQCHLRNGCNEWTPRRALRSSQCWSRTLITLARASG